MIGCCSNFLKDWIKIGVKVSAKIIWLIIFTFFVTVVRAQIPNFSFETWNNVGSYANPDQWGTMNNTTASQGVLTATEGTPGNPGASYLKLTSQTVGMNVINGIAVSGMLDSVTMQPVSGFAFNQRPQSLNVKCQYMYGFATSPSSISVILSRWDTVLNQRVTVATINQDLPGMAMSWSDCNSGFIYQDAGYPDTCIIIFKASGANPNPLDYLWVDNLTFAGTVAGVESPEDIESFNVFPNPTIDVLNININSRQVINSKVRLTNILGKIIYFQETKFQTGNNNLSIPVKMMNIEGGIYFITIITGTTIRTQKLIIQHN